MKNLLLVAFHFPPYVGGSGVHRGAKFFQYLPENGWNPYVLTVSTIAYDPKHQGKAAANVKEQRRKQVIRTFAVDAERHLSFRGRYFKWSAIPDRWTNWVLSGVPTGLLTIYRKNISAIVVTFPIATSVLIGLILHRITRKPLIVDFRDSMTEDGYPRDPMRRSIQRKIEKAIMKRGARFIFTAESARRMYLDRYPDVSTDRCIVISNGYDEEDFAGISAKIDDSGSSRDERPIRLVHAGLIYPDERDPRPLFRALSRLKTEGLVSSAQVRIDLRASGSEEYYSQLIQELKIDDIVSLLPALPHRQALEDMASADALLVLQAANCNHQIPAKIYEYLRLGRPILALTSAAGDTAVLLGQSQGASVVDLADEDSIHDAFPEFIESVRTGSHPLPDTAKVRTYSRRAQTATLAQCLNEVLSSGVKQAQDEPSKSESIA